MRVVVALGGNAILPRGQDPTIDRQRAAIARACGPLARIATHHELVVIHGNGPQVGLLALQAASYDHLGEYPFDVLGALTEGMIGYLVEQELGNRLGPDRVVASLVTRTEVDPADPGFAHPSKFVGPVLTDAEATRVARSRGWITRRDGTRMRRVVASPRPVRIVELPAIRWLLEKGVVVICAGGGGVPAVRSTRADGSELLTGVEAVVDKDLAGAVLAHDLAADLLLIVTDVAGVHLDWGSEAQRLIRRIHPEALRPGLFAPGSMRPKVQAAAQFARRTNGTAVIGPIEDIDGMLAGDAGTVVSAAVAATELAPAQGSTHVRQ